MPKPRSRRWLAVAEACDANPGVWHRVTDDALASWTYHVRTGRIAAFRPEGTYDAILRHGNGLRGTLLVRRNTPTT